MLGFLFRKKRKFTLKEKMEVELVVAGPRGPKSYFCLIKEASPKKAVFTTPKEGKRYVSISPNDIIKCIVLIEDRLYEFNLKVMASMDREFEALISKSVKDFPTLLTDNEKTPDMKVNLEVPLDFRAITTSHLQRAESKTISTDYLEMVTNLPVPEGTELKLIFTVPDSPHVESEGVSEKSSPLEEDSRRSKTRIVFCDLSKSPEVVDKVVRYMVHLQRRNERGREMEEKE